MALKSEVYAVIMLEGACGECVFSLAVILKRQPAIFDHPYSTVEKHAFDLMVDLSIQMKQRQPLTRRLRTRELIKSIIAGWRFLL